MEKGKKDAILLTVIAIATLLVAIVGATFAFFTARLTGAESTNTVTITSASGGTTTFSGGSSITVENIYPRTEAWATKSVVITSASTYAYKYKLTLNYTNSFNAGEVKYTMTPATNYCSVYGKLDQASCTAASGTWETSAAGSFTTNTGWFSSTTGNVDLGEATFADQSTAAARSHAYVLTITYPDTGNNQNYASTNNGSSEDTTNSSNNHNKAVTAWVTITELNS